MEKNLIIDIKILKYDSSHNHPEKEYDVSLSIMKHKIKDGIEKSSIPYEMGLICSEYNSIKSQISRNLNKNYHPMEYNDDIFADANEISVLIERYKNIETKIIDTKC
ncbi:hypothetical protein U3516DRAFT_756420 [Neocallimastix sp. 'constans']